MLAQASLLHILRKRSNYKAIMTMEQEEEKKIKDGQNNGGSQNSNGAETLNVVSKQTSVGGAQGLNSDAQNGGSVQNSYGAEKLNVVSKQNTVSDAQGQNNFLARLKRRVPGAPSMEDLDNNMPETRTAGKNGASSGNAGTGSVSGAGDDAATGGGASVGLSGDDERPVPKSFADQIKEIEYQQSLLNVPTKEEKEAEEKRQKRNALFAALSDGISALSNLYYTTKGAPNAYTGKNTMTEAVQGQYDKIRKDWQDNLNKRNALGMQKYQLENSLEQTRLRQRQANQEMQLKYQEYLLKAEEAAQNGELIQAQKYRQLAAAAKEAAYEAKLKEETKWLGKEKASVIKRNNASAAASYASAENSRASARQHEAQTAKINDDIKNGKNVKSITLHDGKSGTTATVNIPKSKWNMSNVSHLYWILGGKKNIVKPAQGMKGTRSYKPAVEGTPTMAEMEAYIGQMLQIGNKANKQKIDNALNYIKGLESE